MVMRKKYNNATYLHYFYLNYLHNGGYDLASDNSFFMTKQELLSEQLAAYSSRLEMAKENISQTLGEGVEEVDNMLSQLETTGSLISQDEIQVNIEQTSSNKKDIDVFDLESAFQTIDEIPTWASKITEIQNELQNALEQVLTPEQIRLFGNAVMRHYIEDNTVRTHSGAARQIITNFLARKNNSLFRVSKNASQDDIRLTNSVKKSLALLASINVLLNQGTFVSSATIVHKDNTKNNGNNKARNKNQVASELGKKITGLCNNVRGKAEETAVAVGLLGSFVEVYDEVTKKNDNNKNFKKTLVGNKQINIDTRFLEDPLYIEMAEQAKMKLSRATSHTSKADVAITYSNGKGSVSATVVLEGSVKQIEKGEDTDSFAGKATIKLQDGTPLMTYLKREGGLSVNQFEGLIQLLGGHENGFVDDIEYTEKDLDYTWEQIKETVKYRSLFSALAGINEPQNLYAIVQGKIISYGEIIEKISNDTLSVVLADNGSRSKFVGEGLGERKEYMKYNTWRDPQLRNDWYSAQQRSKAAMQNISNKLYGTKIKYSLVISNVQELLSAI